MQEIWLNREELQTIIEFVDKVNPADTLRLQAGVVKITVDNSSGIGSTVTATTVHEYGENEWGDLTIKVSDCENW